MTRGLKFRIRKKRCCTISRRNRVRICNWLNDSLCLHTRKSVLCICEKQFAYQQSHFSCLVLLFVLVQIHVSNTHLISSADYPCSENKGADQLRSYCAADLRLSFRIGKKSVLITRLKCNKLPSADYIVLAITKYLCLLYELILSDINRRTNERKSACSKPRLPETPLFAYAKTKTQISCAIISAFVVAT